MKCANCGTESDGRFCPSCGTELRKSSCSQCGADLPAGARFCTRCGTAVGGPAAGRRPTPKGGNPNLPWYIAGGILVLLIVILLVPMLSGGDDTGTATAPFAPGAVTPGTPPPLTGTPREQADRLFNRIMMARQTGDTAEAKRFTPMAIDAYRMAQPLDDDGLYHLAAVHIVAGDPAAARSVADQVLAREPNHLLALSAAAEAADAAGNAAEARRIYQQLLDAYETESTRTLQEYLDHAQQLPEVREAARRYLAGDS